MRRDPLYEIFCASCKDRSLVQVSRCITSFIMMPVVDDKVFTAMPENIFPKFQNIFRMVKYINQKSWRKKLVTPNHQDSHQSHVRNYPGPPDNMSPVANGNPPLPINPGEYIPLFPPLYS